MGDKTRGLYGKFNVSRRDGSDAPGGKHDRCEYFVLDATHDPLAIVALRAYADVACVSGYELLAADLEYVIRRSCQSQQSAQTATSVRLRIEQSKAHSAATLAAFQQKAQLAAREIVKAAGGLTHEGLPVPQEITEIIVKHFLPQGEC